jgi:hypothetical protein
VWLSTSKDPKHQVNNDENEDCMACPVCLLLTCLSALSPLTTIPPLLHCRKPTPPLFTPTTSPHYFRGALWRWTLLTWRISSKRRT